MIFFTSEGFRQYKIFILCDVDTFVGTELKLCANLYGSPFFTIRWLHFSLDDL